MSDEPFKAFVGGLPEDTITSDVETLLQHCEMDAEAIRQCEIHLVHDRETGKFKGFAYVTFPTEEILNKAINMLNGVDFANKRLKVNRAQPRERHGGGRGGGRGGHGGDRGPRDFVRGGNGGRGNRDEDADGFRKVGGNRHGGGGRDGGRGAGGGRNRYRKSQSEDHKVESHPDESGEGGAPPAERPRLNLKPRTTDPAELEARKKKEQEELAERQAKIFG